MIKSTERFNVNEPVLNPSKLILIRLTVFNSEFSITERENKYKQSNLADKAGSSKEPWMWSTIGIPLGAYKLSYRADII